MVSDKMAEKSSVLVTPKRVHDLLSSFIHKEETGVDERSDEPNQENIAQSSRQFLPRNREAFFARLETFSQAFTWFAKPIELSPLKCAQYGWENTDNDIVKCVSCKEIVCASLPKTWDPDLYAKRCEELRAALVKSHSNICPWRDSPSPDIFLSIPLLNQSEVQGDVLSRCTSLEKLGRKLPVIETCDIESQITAEALSGVVTRQINLLEDIRNDDDSSAINTVCVLSLCGWSTSSCETSQYPTVSCQYCRRQAGLWNFTPVVEPEPDKMTSEEQPTVDSSVESSDADSAQEPSMKKRKISESKKSAFNPITEHRAWCPWVISYVMQQSDDHKSSPVPTYNNIPGWQAVFTLLAPKTSPLKENIQRLTDKDQTPPNQVWKAVRKILSFW